MQLGDSLQFTHSSRVHRISPQEPATSEISEVHSQQRAWHSLAQHCGAQVTVVCNTSSHEANSKAATEVQVAGAAQFASSTPVPPCR